MGSFVINLVEPHTSFMRFLVVVHSGEGVVVAVHSVSSTPEEIGAVAVAMSTERKGAASGLGVAVAGSVMVLESIGGLMVCGDVDAVVVAVEAAAVKSYYAQGDEFVGAE